MRILEGKIYLSFQDLEGYGFSSKYLSKVTTGYRKGERSTYANIPDPDDKRYCLISYDSIPAATRLEKEMPSKAELISQGIIKDQLVRDPRALAFYLDNPHTAPKAKEYQAIASYLTLAAPATVSYARSVGFPGVDGFYQMVMDMMAKERFSLWSISNLDRFKRKLSPFKKACKSPEDLALLHKALSSLISGKIGLKNAAKVNAKTSQAEEMQAAIIKIYADHRKFSIQDTELAYLNIAKDKYQEYIATEGKSGWDEKCFIKGQTIANFLYEPAIQQVWYAARHGQGEARNKFERNTKRLPASAANFKWVIDGTPLHRYFQSKDSLYARIHVFFVVDEATWCILGAGISMSGESSGQVVQSLRAASYNAGIYVGDKQIYVPFELQSDNSAPIQSAPVKHAIDSIGAIYRPSRVGNSKAKIVEPFNKHFFARWVKFREGFTGSMGMSTKLDNKVNQEALTKIVNKKLLPNLAKSLDDLQEDVNNWNNDRTWNNEGVPEESRKSPIEKYVESVKKTAERQKTISGSIAIDAYYWQPANTKQVKDDTKSKRNMKTVYVPQEYTYTNNGIIVERKSPVNGEKLKLEFDVRDPLFNAENIGRKFTLRIEPFSHDHAYLYHNGKPVLDANGERVIAESKEFFHSAIADHTEGEAKRLAEHEDIKKQQKALALSKFEFFQTKAQQAGIDSGKVINPRLWGQKEMTDALKIEAAERLVNPTRYELEEEIELEPIEAKPKKATINRFDI